MQNKYIIRNDTKSFMIDTKENTSIRKNIKNSL